MDSVSALARYNMIGGIVRFMRYLTSKLRVLEFGGVMIVAQDESAKLMIRSLKQCCDILLTEELLSP